MVQQCPYRDFSSMNNQDDNSINSRLPTMIAYRLSDEMQQRRTKSIHTTHCSTSRSKEGENYNLQSQVKRRKGGKGELKMAKTGGDQSRMTSYEVNASSQDYGFTMSMFNNLKLAHLFHCACLLLQSFMVRSSH